MKLLTGIALLLLIAPGASAQHFPENPVPKNETPTIREIRHELLMLPNFGVFDNIYYDFHDGVVTLNGQVVDPALRPEAEKEMHQIEGVKSVVNHIDVLPPSSADASLRMAAFRAIYQYPGLEKYELGLRKPIRIIVKNRNVTLEGFVDSESDRELAGVQARQAQGVRSLTNNLQVVQP